MVAEEHEEGPSHLCIPSYLHVPDVVIVLACSFLRTSLLGSHIVWCTVHTQQSTFISSTIEQYQQA